MHYTVEGAGERVFVGLHGWGSEHQRSFREVLAHLPPDATFYGVDLPGCGRTQAPTDWRWDAIHDQLAAWLDATIAPGVRVSLVGACSGSFHALALAQRRPERVEQLVLLEPFAAMPWFFNIFLKPITGPLLYKLVFDNPLGRAATQASMRRQGVSEGFDMVGAFGTHTSLLHAYQYLRLYGAIEDHRAFASASAPVRVITGERTWRAIHDSVALWRENWPTLEAIQLEGVGHMFNQEAPERAAQVIFAPPRGAGVTAAASRAPVARAR